MPALLLLWQNKTIRYGLLIVLGLLLFYVFARRAGKKKGEAQAMENLKQEPLPNNGSGIPKGWDPQNLANQLYEAMNSFTTTGTAKGQLFRRCLDLTDDQTTALYNRFNALFGPKGKGSLTKWVDDEFNRNGLFDSYGNEFLARLRKLNLK